VISPKKYGKLNKASSQMDGQREENMLDPWMLLQVAGFGGLLWFSSYLAYRRRLKLAKKFKRKNAILV
jgi:hypothetical protein